MTNQEINERVAKLCEWYREVDADGNVTWCKHGKYMAMPPNYAESLDLCRGFEAFKTGEEWSVYIDTIAEICDGDNDPVVATPLQRCEAFLRLKGQWDEN